MTLLEAGKSLVPVKLVLVQCSQDSRMVKSVK